MKQYFIVLSRERLTSPSRLLALLLAMGLSMLLLACSGKSNSGKSNSSADIPTEYCDELVKLAEDGNAEAQYSLATVYANGDGVAQSDIEAAKWCRKAAEQGYPVAQCNLGVFYVIGRGIPQSYSEAAKWYRKAADQGIASAQFNLGLLYNDGKGVSQSYSEAAKWYRKAAEQGDPDAQYNLGILYTFGQGVSQSDSEGVKWFRKASEQDYAAAQYNLYVAYWKGQGVEQSRSEAVEWLKKSAAQGDPDALYAYGSLLYDARQYETAMRMFAWAAANGLEKAVEMLNDWVLPMAKQGIAEAQYSMGLYYQEKDKIDDAIPWFSLSAEQGYQDAIKALEEIKEKANKEGKQ